MHDSNFVYARGIAYLVRHAGDEDKRQKAFDHAMEAANWLEETMPKEKRPGSAGTKKNSVLEYLTLAKQLIEKF